MWLDTRYVMNNFIWQKPISLHRNLAGCDDDLPPLLPTTPHRLNVLIEILPPLPPRSIFPS